MHVLLLSSGWPEPSIGGSGRPLPELAAMLQRAGHTVGAVILEPTPVGRRPKPLTVRTEDGVVIVQGGVQTIRVGGFPGSRALVRRRTEAALRRYVNAAKARPDVVHVHGAFPGLHMGGYATRRFECGFVYTVHDTSALLGQVAGFRNSELRADMYKVSVRSAIDEPLRQRLSAYWRVGAWHLLPLDDEKVFVDTVVGFYERANGAVLQKKVETDLIDC
ncbi:glycosyltransferase [Actinomyces radicidentis]|uniref:Glycosyltransferase subfamily 4-like N-terminal domain-containing protein n=1 Tax=Actinomyces radicidentis TaxID=111015 RepID=A0A109W234_ACTRD|nr:glycosyltransferase [Actinomyces radicidentis]AMD86553.1 hypothetical protein AXF14_01700 [Actinomyces radicidentis]